MTESGAYGLLPEVLNIIEGSPEAPEPAARAWLTDPNTGQRAQPMVSSQPHAVERAISHATRVFDEGGWAAAPIDRRCELLAAFADGLGKRQHQIAVSDSFATGIPFALTLRSVSYLPAVVQGAISQLQAAATRTDVNGQDGPVSILRLPWGPAAVIAPFNAPAFTATKKAAYAIAAGCPVIVKPSELAPHSATLVGQAFLDAAARCEAPAGLLQVVNGAGDVGAQLAGDFRIRTLTFTGGRAAGTSIARAAAGDFKTLQLECSSNNPAIVLDDADPGSTADALVEGFTRMNGQWCEAPGSVIVAGGMLGTLVDAVAERLRTMRIGHSAAGDTQFGPQGNPAQSARVQDEIAALKAAGGTAVVTSELPDLAGYFVAPTVVTGVDVAAVTGDMFGPLLTFHPAPDDDAALRLANRTRCGLAGYVFTRDVERGMRVGAQMQAGEIRVNGTGVSDLCEESVQGFWGGSGIGGHGNADLFQLYRGARIVGAET